MLNPSAVKDSEQDDTGSLYQRLADDLAGQIQAGTFRPGERLPSVRQLAGQQKVSVSTAVSAYQYLEAEGLIQSRPKSGFFVTQPSLSEIGMAAPETTRGLKPTQLNMSDAIAGVFRKTRDRECVHFDLAVPHANLQPTTQLKAAANRVLRQHFDRCLDLIPSPGEPELRRLIALRMNRLGSQLVPDDLVITNGCQEALLIALQAVTSPGDVVAVEMPCYYGFLQALESLGLTVVSIATDALNGLDVNALEAAAQRWPIRACLCAPTFSNPTGGCMPEENKNALLALAQSKNFYIIEDDIFGELGYDDGSAIGRPQTLHAMASQKARKNRRYKSLVDRVLYCSSFSKSLSPGLRIGWVVAGSQRLRVMERQRATTTATASLSQWQLIEYLKSGHYDKHLARVRPIYQRNVEKALRVIAESFPQGTSVTQPRGGFVLWLSLPAKCANTEILLQRALDAQISFVPGQVFGLTGLNQCLRLSVAQPWTQSLEESLRLLGQLASS